jgi:hypothetical protein
MGAREFPVSRENSCASCNEEFTSSLSLYRHACPTKLARSRGEQRLMKFQALARHEWYGKLCQKISEHEFDLIVEFIEDFGELDDQDFERKVVRYGLDDPNKPKNANIIADLLLACKTTEVKK